jgi:putative nucleotidyltransferase with HDIG domain
MKASFANSANTQKGSARSRRKGRDSRTLNFLEASPLIAISLFVLFGIVLVTICFWKLPIAGPHTFALQKPPQRIISTISFTYESEIRTAAARDERRSRVLPVYTVDMSPYERFVLFWMDLQSKLTELNTLHSETPDENTVAAAEEQEFRVIAEELTQRYHYHLSPTDIEIFYRETDPELRVRLTNALLPILQSLFQRGIQDTREWEDENNTEQGITPIHLNRSQEVRRNEETNTIKKAEGTLYIEISDIVRVFKRSASLSDALNRIFKESIVPNIRFDAEQTRRKQKEAEERVAPFMDTIRRGDIIVDTGTGSTLSDLEMERLQAYRKQLKNRQEDLGSLNPRFREQIILTLTILVATFFFFRTTKSDILRSNRKVASTILVLLIQLGLIRLILQLIDSSAAQHPYAPHVLPYLLPFAFAPIMIVVLLGVGPALFVSIFLSAFIALMFNGSLLIFILSLLASTVGIYFSRSIRKRSKLVKAGFFSGVAAAICALLLGLSMETAWEIIMVQILTSLTIGFLTGTLLAGVLPIIENLFRYTTDITLLELTDYNHPLLRELQLRAPGSYHHSLMLANLTENAAAAIGANPLLARVCSYYHDVGKMVKPEYFIENQVDGINPHLEKNPSMSALVIKAHVKEGVALARQHKLPQVIIDVIQQHHGTSLIQYFYSRAKDQERKKTRDPFGIIDVSEISESTYRYDGPRPRFKESAIIFLGDALEAASRTLRKASIQNIDELIDKLFDERIRDGQLDEAPLTFADISKIKKSFSFTLVNALHARIEYPSEKREENNAKEKPSTEPTSEKSVVES